jgi:hypothetical protein
MGEPVGLRRLPRRTARGAAVTSVGQ